MATSLDDHNYHGIDATIIADSKNEHGQRITSYVCTFPRIVLSEFNTHRMLSRNSASSRAIPFKKMVESIKKHPFIPIKWMKDHSGMQGNEYFTDDDQVKPSIYPAGEEGKNHFKVSDILRQDWLRARDHAVYNAESMSELGLTKQVVNRLLEPFKWHTVIVTATQWENFFALRAHEAAEIHIQDLAFRMLDEYNNSEPKLLKEGQWHIPFGDNMDIERLAEAASLPNSSHTEFDDVRIKIATARCARVSYENFEGTDDYTKDIKLHDRLASMGHWSPFEHCAKAMSEKELNSNIRGCVFTEDILEIPDSYEMSIRGWSGNFQGFVQYRKMFENENKTDDRIQ